jgi:hypothetical protein
MAAPRCYGFTRKLSVADRSSRRTTPNMKTVARNVLAVLLGIIVGTCVNMALVALGPMLIPPPAGVDMSDATSLNRSMHLLGPRHFLFPFLAHACGTFAGAAVAYLLAANHRRSMSIVVGAFFLLGGIAAATMISAPTWFMAVDLLFAYLPMAWLGGHVASRFVRS